MTMRRIGAALAAVVAVVGLSMAAGAVPAAADTSWGCGGC